MSFRIMRPFSPASRCAAAALVLVLRGALAGSPSPAPAPTIGISVKAFMFAPASLTVKAGSTVTWTNLDEEPHAVFSESGLFRSGALDTNDSFSYTFRAPGIYRYLCTIHPRMRGTIVVE
jgi:plastocyanin